MDKKAIKTFAVWARKHLMKEVSDVIDYLQVDNPTYTPATTSGNISSSSTYFMSEQWKKQREELTKQIKDKWKENLVEEIAYSWFNRFIALRFMEVNKYLSFWPNILSWEDFKWWEPEILNKINTVDVWLNKDLFWEYLDRNDRDWLYKQIIIKVCNELNNKLPFMFERIDDYTELFFPKNLFYQNSFLKRLVNDIPVEDWQQVEIVGWLYQYYISEKKDEVFELFFKRKAKISKESIPAATQIFTSEWLVKYIVENSVWKTWLESFPDSELKNKRKYLVETQSNNESNKISSPEDITVLDPAMWSWHILVYAFEVLYDIYKSFGYQDSKIPKLIIEKNLYWLEIDERAKQLACFALTMKARKYNKNLFDESIQINLLTIEESKECWDIEKEKYPNLSYLCKSFLDAKTYGSLIRISEFDKELCIKEYEQIKKNATLFNNYIIEKLPHFIQQAELLYKVYDCVVSNPPYMWSWKMNKQLAEYLKKNYPDTKSDLFSAFIERCLDFTKVSGYASMITMQSWMFLSSYEKLREHILSNKKIDNILHLWAYAFQEMRDHVFWVLFTIKNHNSWIQNSWIYIRLVDFMSENLKKRIFLDMNKTKQINCYLNEEILKNSDKKYIGKGLKSTPKLYYTQNQSNFKSIPWTPIAYWVSDRVREIFEKSESLWEIAEPKQWLASSDNNRFRRNWSEVNFSHIWFNWYKNESKRFPYNSWGDFRKYYWNQDYIINRKNNWYEIKNCFNNKWKLASRPQNTQYYFSKSISWSKISSSKLSMRYYQSWFIFDVAGCSIFMKKWKEENSLYILWILNSNVILKILSSISPTLNYEVWQVSSLPIIFPNSQETKDQIDKLTQQNIDISKEEWDSRETSWDFQQNELVRLNSDNSIQTAVDNYKSYRKEKFFQQHRNEEELNRLFIEIYWLEDEMSPDIDLEDITLLKEEKEIKDWKLEFQEDVLVKQLISYWIGVILWRYSLDMHWLAFAGWEFDRSKYNKFKPDDDWIIPVLSEEYFSDDIVSRFKEFIRVSFWDDKLQENLEYIADILWKKWNETSLQTIRRYFIKDFYKEHVKTYKKRPIYWMFSSWESFNAIMYLHRYNKTTLSKLRIDYLHKFQSSLEQGKQRVENDITREEDSKKKNQLDKKRLSLIKQLEELRKYDEILKDLSDRQIELDLDDWVKVNYWKLQDLLEDIKL